MAHSNLMLVLHAHLPFVRHPEYPKFLEETWLFEAISETYLPLLRVMDRLESDQVPMDLCMSVSPTLMAMLQDELLQDRYVQHLDMLIELGEKETDRTKDDPDFSQLARMYLDLFRRNRHDFLERYDRDLLGALNYHEEGGRIELITTFGTHPYVPLYQHQEASVDAQLRVAIETHQRALGRRPTGFWLPECGYYPGVEELLARQGIEYFFVAAHGLLFADEKPRHGVFSPVRCPNGTVAFGRDYRSSSAVWSSEDGYPGHPSYRDFYRDIGHDLSLDYVAPYIHDGKNRINTGFKYHAITGNTDDKRPYRLDEAGRIVYEHAENFLYRQLSQARKLTPIMDRSPVVVCPFDAELFGHWWFEGPQWLEALFRVLHKHNESSPEYSIRPVKPHSYLKRNGDFQVIQPAFSSWGNNGYSEVWLDGSNDWIYRHTHKVIERMVDLVDRFPNETGLKRRALNQAAREVLLSQASDWPFIMRAGTTVTYAKHRLCEHLQNFNRIHESLSRGSISTEWLTKIERRNTIFPFMDYRIFRGLSADSLAVGGTSRITSGA